MMKRALLATLVAVALSGLLGCQPEEEKPAETGTATESAETTTAATESTESAEAATESGSTTTETGAGAEGAPTTEGATQ